MVARFPAWHVLALLHEEADKRSDERFRIKPATLRQWVRRKHITRGDGGYCVREIVAYIDGRERRHAA